MSTSSRNALRLLDLSRGLPSDIHALPLPSTFQGLILVPRGRAPICLLLVDDNPDFAGAGLDLESAKEEALDLCADVLGAEAVGEIWTWSPGSQGEDGETDFVDEPRQTAAELVGRVATMPRAVVPNDVRFRLIGYAASVSHPRTSELAAMLDPGPVGEAVVEQDLVQVCRRPQGNPSEDARGNAHAFDLRRTLGKGVHLRGPSTGDEIDELAARLYEASPWARDAILAITRSGRRNLDGSRRHFKIDPIVIVGPPGSGKSKLALLAGELSGLPHALVDAGAATSPAPFVGLDSSWRSASPSVAIATMAEHRCANPLIVIDEIDKARPFGHEGVDPAEALLPLLEQTTSDRFLDPFLKVEVDYSHVSWIFTANDASKVPAPFRDRCTMIELPRPSGADLEAFTRRLATEAELDTDISDLLVSSVMKMRNPSLRSIVRAVQAAESEMHRPVLN